MASASLRKAEALGASERRITRKTAKKVLGAVFTDTAYNLGSEPVRPNEQAIKKTFVLSGGAGRGTELPSAKSTDYGLLNAVTEYVDHERWARSTDNRLESAWFGNGTQIKQRALEQTLALIT